MIETLPFTTEDAWRPVPSFEGHYEVSTSGQVRSVKFGKQKLMRPTLDTDSYRGVCLCKQGTIIRRKVAKLVALAFIPNPENLPVINHKNGNKTDDNVGNLEWCSVKHNTRHAMRLGLLNCRGEQNPGAKLTAMQVDRIRTLYADGDHTQRQLGKLFEVSQRAIGRIVNRTHWITT